MSVMKKVRLLRMKLSIRRLERMRENAEVGSLRRTVLDSVIPVTRNAYNSLRG